MNKLSGRPPARLEIEVTTEDLCRGVKGDDLFCPIALAAQRALRGTGAEAVVVWLANMIVYRKDDVVVYAMPEEAQSFVQAFDRAQPVRPFRATLRKKRKDLG